MSSQRQNTEEVQIDTMNNYSNRQKEVEDDFDIYVDQSKIELKQSNP